MNFLKSSNRVYVDSDESYRLAADKGEKSKRAISARGFAKPMKLVKQALFVAAHMRIKRN